MRKNKKKYIPFFLLICLFSIISYLIGAYSNYYRIFPFNPSTKLIKEEQKITSIFYDFNMEKFNIPLVDKYGGIDILNNKIFFISGDGKKFYLDEKNLKFINVGNLNLKLNKKEFIKKYEKVFGKLKLQRRFGIKDIFIGKFNNNKILFISTIYYNKSDDCYNLSLYTSKIIDEKKYKFSNPIKNFETKKCLKIYKNNTPSSANLKLNKNFAPSSSAGRIEKIDDEHILLTVGDFLHDGVNSDQLVQDLSNDYGKILKINISNFSYEIFSIGHRNPQGLTVVNNNIIFSSEHGPMGGDEINKIEKNANYGWPYYTYGTDYGEKNWPINGQITIEKYKGPIFSWTPSIAVSNLVYYSNAYLPQWKNNLIVSTLKDKNILRIILSNDYNKVMNIEVIKIDYRMRDIIIDNRGRIIILTDTTTNKETPKILILNKS